MSRPAGEGTSPQLLFRTAESGDVRAVVALVESAYRGVSSRAGWTTEAHLLAGQRTDAAAITAVIADPTATLILAEAPTLPTSLSASQSTATGTGTLLGCCELARRTGYDYFGTFAVQPRLQGAGIGRQVLAEAERRARDHGVDVMEMTVLHQREDLIAWYRRRGYTPTGETRPFPYGDERFGRPRRPDLVFDVLTKVLG